MGEVLITLVIAVIVFYILYWLAGKLPAEMATVARIIVVAGGLLWLLYHAREIIHAIASGTP